MGIIQADSLWDCKKQRKTVVDISYESVCLYPGNKCRSNSTHADSGYHFFGHHNKYRKEIATYVERQADKGYENVSSTLSSLYVLSFS